MRFFFSFNPFLLIQKRTEEVDFEKKEICLFVEGEFNHWQTEWGEGEIA
jgi:hypothetical protein